ncbi:MAG: 3-methyl-2-oxobutanoate hydroxymethyltransferase [Kiritimatiellia bacterium]
MSTPVKMTTRRLMSFKGRHKIAMVTAHDHPTARLADEAGLPVLLVGDSLAMTVLGHPTTLPVTMDEMIHHTKAVVRGARQALVVADMPFLSYQISQESALANAGRFLKEAGADAVKLEGGAERAGVIQALVTNGIPVMGHIGLLPQSVKELGGYKVQGRNGKEAEQIVLDALALQAAGVFALVIEAVPAGLAARITAELTIPVIGIGAGPDCDGQVLVANDLLGIGENNVPKFVKTYANLGMVMRQAFTAYRTEVESGKFPGREHGY